MRVIQYFPKCGYCSDRIVSYWRKRSALGFELLTADAYFAAGSDCIMPKICPSVSLQYASQPTPGIAILGTAIEPPWASTEATLSSRLATPTVLTHG